MLCCKTAFLSTGLLAVEPHVPSPEPVCYDKKDGKWYTHEGVDVKDTQQRKGNFILTWKLNLTNWTLTLIDWY